MASTQSTRYYFITDLKAKIEENANIKYVDLYNGQDTRPQEEQSFDRPAVLIEIESIGDMNTKLVDGSVAGNTYAEKDGVLVFSLHFWFHFYDYEIARFTDTDATIQAVDKAVEGMYDPDKAYRPVKKIEERLGPESTGQWIWIITYAVPIEEEGVSRGLVTKTGVVSDISADIVPNI
ncbi:MAG: hypothetical protein GY861_05495 [bacterium]|nr:hypothetical protein [bacterium]